MARTFGKRCRHILVIGACALVMLAIPTTVLKRVSAERVFKRIVIHPVPQSVRGIKADRDWREIIGHIYVLRFKISQPDLSVVLNSRPFSQVEWVEYDDGSLCWGDAPLSERRDSVMKIPQRIATKSFALYSSKGILGRRPWWFRLKHWEHPDVYVFEEERERRVQILIYNDKSAEAYFIERQFAR